MKRVVLLFLVLIVAATVPQTARACEICLHGECLWVGPPDGGYCLETFYPYQDCTFQPSPDCSGCCFLGMKAETRAGAKKLAQATFNTQWSIASVDVNGKVQSLTGNATRIATNVLSSEVQK